MGGLRRTLFREPRAGVMPDRSWFVLAGVGAAIGCLMVVAGLLFSGTAGAGGSSYSPGLVVLGSMFALQFAAELLPKGWNITAGLLRIGAISVAAVSLLLILVF